MFQEFKTFLMRGNVVDLAVGVIIGGAFGAIVDALVKNLIMPIIGIATGGVDFAKASFKVGAVELGYGAVVQAIFQFIVIGFVLFMILRGYNKAVAAKAAEPAPPAPPTPSEELLAEIKSLMQRVESNTRK